MTHPIQQQQNPEPWIPDGLLEKLVVEARVRVRFSAECKTPLSNLSTSAELGYKYLHEGSEAANNRIGRIFSTDDPLYANHPYEVQIDEPYELGGHYYYYIFAAACELIPLSENEDLCWMEDDPAVCARGTHGCDVHEPVTLLSDEGRER